MRYALLLLACACGDNVTLPFLGLVQVSSDSPLASCPATSAKGQAVIGMEVEPQLAADPTNDRHLVGMWQQDRWSTGGSNGLVAARSLDGGQTWVASQPAFSSCQGGRYDRATDPWIAITPSGPVYALGLVFDADAVRSGVLAARSTDGGMTWDTPAALLEDDDPDVFNDKDAITADPHQPDVVYAVWDRLTGVTMPTQPVGTGPTMFARATSGVWEPAKAIFDPGVDQQTIGNEIVVLPDGTLVDVFDRIGKASSATPTEAATVIRSTDHGDTWSGPIDIGAMTAEPVIDPKSTLSVRTGDVLPQIAVDASGVLYVTWEEALGTHEAIVVSVSQDGGLTWSPPVAVNGAPGANAFTPTIAASGNTVGVLYTDDRNDLASNTDVFDVTTWLVTSTDHGATWSEEQVSGDYDLQHAIVGAGYFLGDYQGLAPGGSGFVPFFAAAVSETDPTAIFTRPE